MRVRDVFAQNQHSIGTFDLVQRWDLAGPVCRIFTIFLISAHSLPAMPAKKRSLPTSRCSAKFASSEALGEPMPIGLSLLDMSD